MYVIVVTKRERERERETNVSYVLQPNKIMYDVLTVFSKQKKKLNHVESVLRGNVLSSKRIGSIIVGMSDHSVWGEITIT
jgi:hypothetical protein